MKQFITVRLYRPEGYEDVHPEILLDDFMNGGDKKAFQPEIVAEPAPVGCEVCEGTGRLGCLPDDNEHTHPCDTCQPEANKEFQRGVAFGEAVARSE